MALWGFWQGPPNQDCFRNSFTIPPLLLAPWRGLPSLCFCPPHDTVHTLLQLLKLCVVCRKQRSWIAKLSVMSVAHLILWSLNKTRNLNLNIMYIVKITIMSILVSLCGSYDSFCQEIRLFGWYGQVELLRVVNTLNTLCTQRQLIGYHFKL